MLYSILNDIGVGVGVFGTILQGFFVHIHTKTGPTLPGEHDWTFYATAVFTIILLLTRTYSVIKDEIRKQKEHDKKFQE